MTKDKPRRPKDSGSIYTRKDGRVVGEYEANEKKRYIYGKTKKDVAAKLAKVIADRDAGLAYDSGKLTVGAYLDIRIYGYGNCVARVEWCLLKKVGGRWVIGKNAVVLIPPERMRQPVKLIRLQITHRETVDYLREILCRQELADAGCRAW